MRLIRTAASLRTGTVRRSSIRALAAAVVFLLLAGCGGSDGGDSAGSDSAVTIEGFTFKPASITVPAGTTVSWTNEDAFAHSVKPADDLFPVSPNIDPAGTFRHTYDQAGTYPYICGIHNSMTGTVVVT